MGSQEPSEHLSTLVETLPDGTEVLGGFLANLTLGIALDGIDPTPPPLAEAVGGTFGSIRLDGLGGTLEHHEGQLRVRLHQLPGKSAIRPINLGFLMNKPVCLRLADGNEVAAELGRHTRASAEFAELELDHWRYGPEPAAWVARLQGIEFEQGNLFVGRGTPKGPEVWSHKNLRLAGRFTWHIVRTQEGYSAVIEADRPLTPAFIHADITALEFTLGLRLNLGVLTGVDRMGRPTSAAAPIMTQRYRPVSPPLPPVPPWMERQTWTARFFSSMSRALVGPDATRFYVAINTYLDSLSENLDSAYLRLQVALEAFCRHGDPPLPSLAVDEGKWRAWVEGHRGEIELHATDAHAAQRLMEKVRKAPMQRPSADAVPAAFAGWKLCIPDKEASELDGRHLAVHRYSMNESDGNFDVARDMIRVSIVRTLLLAAVARTAGYGGPIHGWTGLGFGTPSWWPVSEAGASAQHWYACLRSESEERTT